MLPALRGLLPAGGLQRGHVVTTPRGCCSSRWPRPRPPPGPGARPSACRRSACARPLTPAWTRTGCSWSLSRGNWPQVVASLLDGCDVVLLCPPARPAAQLRRKLEAAARRFGSVLLVAGEWEGAQARLLIADQEWAGIGAGHGRLRARRAQIVAEGRGAGAARGRLALAAGSRRRSVMAAMSGDAGRSGPAAGPPG